MQGAHDLIAAWYRFSRRHELLFPLAGNPESEWIDFAQREVDHLCSNPRFVIATLDAVIFANIERGYAGEREAQAILQSRYLKMREHRLPNPSAETVP